MSTHPKTSEHTPAPSVPATRIFGVGVQTGTPAELLRQIIGFAERGEHRRVSYVNAHVLNQSQRDPELRRALQACDLV
ncbi:MAG: hypothetical protein AABM31_11070, partial [Actinomycetota bacterium]